MGAEFTVPNFFGETPIRANLAYIVFPVHAHLIAEGC